jgi:hypothetical protein
MECSIFEKPKTHCEAWEKPIVESPTFQQHLGAWFNQMIKIFYG